MARPAPAPSRPAVLLALALALLPASAQQDVQVLPRGVAVPPLEDLPRLPALGVLPPRDSLLWADRIEVGQGALPAGAGDTGGALVNALLPASLTGTGKGEHIQYLLPPGHDGTTPVPLLVAWRGFGSSAASVSLQTTLDEECAVRGWAYLAVTGIDDKLFGPPVSQQNVAAAIAWMQAEFPIDAERIWMVGFSMGAGCAANFAARHRDPDGLTVAALGLVAGSYDWTQTWVVEPSVRTWLENAWNFGGPPATQAFAYQRSSALHHDPGSYPPLPGLHLDGAAMAQNLHATPAFITWDVGDTLAHLPAQSGTLADMLSGLGGTVVPAPVSGTTDPATGLPATHSWAVLDEGALCDFLAGHVAQRRPLQLVAQVDERRPAAWLTLEPAGPQGFARALGVADAAGGTLAISQVEGAARALVAPWAPAPWQLAGTPAGAGEFLLGVAGSAEPAGWALQAGLPTAEYEFDPQGDGLLLRVDGPEAFEVHAASFDAALGVTPDPVAPGGAVTIGLQAATGNDWAWLLVGLRPAALPGAAGLLAIEPVPPFLVLPVGLDASGDLALPAAVPASPALSGVFLLLQAAVQGPASGSKGLSNPFRFDIL